MEIHDRVRVSAPPEVVWATFLDVERVAPCLPGAQLDEIEADEFRGRVKVKVGPIQAQYRGAASLADVDDDARRLVISASGRDTRGQGNAAATITVQVAAEDGDGSVVTIDTDLTVTGRVAQLGRGVLGDVSAKLLGQFAENVEELWGEEPGETAPEAAAAAAKGTVPGAPSGAASGPAPAGAGETEAVDLLELGGGAVARRLVPLLVAGLAFGLVWWVIRHRRSGRS